MLATEMTGVIRMTTATIAPFTITAVLSWSKSCPFIVSIAKAGMIHGLAVYLVLSPGLILNSIQNSVLENTLIPSQLLFPITIILVEFPTHWHMDNGKSLPLGTSQLISFQFWVPLTYTLHVARGIFSGNSRMKQLPTY